MSEHNKRKGAYTAEESFGFPKDEDGRRRRDGLVYAAASMQSYFAKDNCVAAIQIGLCCIVIVVDIFLKPVSIWMRITLHSAFILSASYSMLSGGFPSLVSPLLIFDTVYLLSMYLVHFDR